MEAEVNVLNRLEASEERVSTTLWITFFICMLSTIFAGVVSTLMSVYLPVIVNTYVGSGSFEKISAMISALYVAGWALGGFTWGFLTDRIGRVKSLVICVAGYSIFSVLIGYATSWEMIVIYRLLSGFAVGGLMVITPTLLSEVWPAASRSVILGIDSIGFPIGIFSSGLVTFLASDWRQAFKFAGAPIVFAVVALWIARESPVWRSAVKTRTNLLDKTYRKNIVKGAVIFGSMLIGMWAIFSWIPTWVQSILPDPDGQTERSLTMMVVGAAGLTGGFLSGWTSNSLGVRRSMLICFAGCFVMSVILFGLNTVFSKTIYFEAAILAVFFGMSQGLLSIYITQLFPSSIRATATGFCFNAGRVFTAVAVFFVGAMVTTLGGYGHALLVFSGIFVAGFLTILYSKEDQQLKTTN